MKEETIKDKLETQWIGRAKNPLSEVDLEFLLAMEKEIIFARTQQELLLNGKQYALVDRNSGELYLEHFRGWPKRIADEAKRSEGLGGLFHKSETDTTR